MSAIEARLWVPGRWDEEKKTWIPLLEEARKVVPNIDEERVVKWVQDGAVELKVVNVYHISAAPAFIGVKWTIVPPYKKVQTLELAEVAIYVNEKEVYKFYIPKFLINRDNITALAKLLSEYVSALAEYAGLVVETVEFNTSNILHFVEGEEARPNAVKARDEDFEDIYIKLTGNTTRGWWLESGRSYIIETEWVKIPTDMLPKDVKLRSSYRRLGWDGHPSNVDPGFEGHIIFTIYSLPDAPPLVIEEGARIVQVRLYKLERPLPGYRGQYQGV